MEGEKSGYRGSQALKSADTRAWRAADRAESKIPYPTAKRVWSFQGCQLRSGWMVGDKRKSQGLPLVTLGDTIKLFRGLHTVEIAGSQFNGR